MSFSVDLWNGFDIIKNEFSINQKRIKQILDILSSYSYIQKDYFKNLDNLYKEIKESKDVQKSNSLLDDSINLLIKSIKIESEKNKNIYNKICENITEIKGKLDIMKTQIATYFNENIQNKDSFSRILNHLIGKQESFNKSFKELCYYMAENEAQKLMEGKSQNKTKKNERKNNSADKSKIDEKYQKEKYMELLTKNYGYQLNTGIVKETTNKETPSKMDNLVKKLLESKKEYIKCISESNKERENYNNLTDGLLNQLQNQYKLIIFLFHTVINNYIKIKIKSYNDILEIHKSNDNNYYSKINYKKETIDFIIRNATKEFPMNKLEFIPYKIDKKKLNDKLTKYGELSKEDQEKVINLMKNYININKLNIFESEFSQQSAMNNKSTNKIGKVNRSRRSGSTDKYSIKYCGNNNILTKFNDNNKNINNNIRYSKNKDDILLNMGNKKKSDLLFIKDFVYKLFNYKEEPKKDLYTKFVNKSPNEKKSENKDNKNEKKVDIYNELLYEFMELIDSSNKDHMENLNFFISILDYNRSRGNFELNEKIFKIFVIIFSHILNNYNTSDNIIKNLIVFSQTLYKKDNQKSKTFIITELKNHIAFNNVETWHRAINYNLSLSIKNDSYSLNIINKDEYIKNLNKIVLNTIISYLYDLRLSTNDNNVYEQVKNFYIAIYDLNKDFIETTVNKLFDEMKSEKNDIKEGEEETNEKENDK